MNTYTYAQLLCDWYEENKREMPWRLTRDPYKIWVSEVMLQQTQVDTVIPYYNRFLERFPTIEALARASLEEVFSCWQGLGYYTRARNLHKGAAYIMAHFNGQFPSDMEKVRKIPGIGAYTAGAVLSIAFNQPHPAVDGNVMRVLSRQRLIDEDIAKEKTKRVFEKEVLSLMGGEPRVFNQALMELGALVCLPRNPKCEECPMKELCGAYQNEIVEAYPVKSKKVASPVDGYIALLLIKDRSVWMEKRPEKGLLAGLWGFPLISSHEGERLMNEPDKKLPIVRHVFTHRIWEMTPVIYKIESLDAFQGVIDSKAGSFISFDALETQPIGSAFRKLIQLSEFESLL